MTEFPRGGRGPAQPVSKGATIALILVSIAAIVGTVTLLKWSLG